MTHVVGESHDKTYLRGWNEAVEQCVEAAFNAYHSTTRDQYVMEGHAGMAKRMINAIKSVRDDK